jgi:hypothetical protein
LGATIFFHTVFVGKGEPKDGNCVVRGKTTLVKMNEIVKEDESLIVKTLTEQSAEHGFFINGIPDNSLLLELRYGENLTLHVPTRSLVSSFLLAFNASSQ